MSAPAPVLLLGKLPAHGDFVGRGVAPTERELLDAWLSEWLAAVRAATGEGFAAAWESAAPWLWESPETTAVLLPSTDAVGRLYPLLALAAADRPTQAVYDAMVDALAEGSDIDSLASALAAIAPAAREAGAAGWFLPEGAEASLPAPDTVPSWAQAKGILR